MIKKFARHHMKVEDIKIEEDLAHQVWSRNSKSPRKIEIRMSKTMKVVFLFLHMKRGWICVTPAKETPKVEDK